jgi:hypothetical protein
MEFDRTAHISLFHGVLTSSLSKEHSPAPDGKPYVYIVNGQEFRVEYWPADSKSGMFGGNSNWRGPIWLGTPLLHLPYLTFQPSTSSSSRVYSGSGCITGMTLPSNAPPAVETTCPSSASPVRSNTYPTPTPSPTLYFYEANSGTASHAPLPPR